MQTESKNITFTQMFLPKWRYFLRRLTLAACIDREGFLTKHQISAVFEQDDKLRRATLKLLGRPGLHGVADLLAFCNLLDALGRRVGCVCHCLWL